VKITVNITKLFQCNPNLIKWINKAETSNPKKLHTSSVNPVYFVEISR
jgi:hypothetical protein